LTRIKEESLVRTLPISAVVKPLLVWLFISVYSRDSRAKLREFSFSSSSFVLGFAFYYDHEDDDEDEDKDDFIAVCRGGSIRGQILFQKQIHTIEIDDGMMRGVVSAACSRHIGVLSGNSLCCAKVCPRITLIDANP
jgi:hypothetical protein